MRKRILFLAPYPLGKAPSQRFRFELFLDNLNHCWEFQSFYDEPTWQILYKEGKYLQKITGLLSGYLRRFKSVFWQSKFDWVYVHRELAPFGPPIFERLINSEKLIYDFDDAIWMNDGHDKNMVWKWLRHRQKVWKICSHSARVTVGNAFLAEYARAYAESVEIMPTLVNARRHKPVQKEEKSHLVIGWTGSHTTLFYLQDIVPVIQRLQKKFNFYFLVIANEKPALELEKWGFEKWSEALEVEQLNKMDIGIMPLKDTAWEQGKCGFKLIQYGSVGMPSVASPVGVNKEVISHAETGFLAKNESEWYEHLTTLIESDGLRKNMGDSARERIVANYSKDAWSGFFADLFDRPI